MDKFSVPLDDNISRMFVYSVCDPVTNEEIRNLFVSPFHECDIDGYKVMSATIRRFRVYAILSDDNDIMSYCVTEPVFGGNVRLKDIHTYEEYRRNNLAAIIIFAITTKIILPIVIDTYSDLSPTARTTVDSVISSGRFRYSKTSENYDEVLQLATSCTVISAMRHESRYIHDIDKRFSGSSWYFFTYDGCPIYD